VPRSRRIVLERLAKFDFPPARSLQLSKVRALPAARTRFPQNKKTGAPLFGAAAPAKLQGKFINRLSRCSSDAASAFLLS